MKETIKKAAKRILFDNTGMLTKNHPTILQSMIDLAKWQQQRMYSEEEVNDLLEMLKHSISEINHLKYTYKDKGHCGKYLFDCETIIEQFKKQ